MKKKHKWLVQKIVTAATIEEVLAKEKQAPVISIGQTIQNELGQKLSAIGFEIPLPGTGKVESEEEEEK